METHYEKVKSASAIGMCCLWKQSPVSNLPISPARFYYLEIILSVQSLPFFLYLQIMKGGVNLPPVCFCLCSGFKEDCEIHQGPEWENLCSQGPTVDRPHWKRPQSCILPHLSVPFIANWFTLFVLMQQFLFQTAGKNFVCSLTLSCRLKSQFLKIEVLALEDKVVGLTPSDWNFWRGNIMEALFFFFLFLPGENVIPQTAWRGRLVKDSFFLLQINFNLYSLLLT